MFDFFLQIAMAAHEMTNEQFFLDSEESEPETESESEDDHRQQALEPEPFGIKKK